MKVIAYKEMPSRLPFMQTAVLYLLLDHFRSPGYVWGVAFTMMAIYWIVAIVVLCVQEQTLIFTSREPIRRAGEPPKP